MKIQENLTSDQLIATTAAQVIRWVKAKLNAEPKPLSFGAGQKYKAFLPKVTP